MFNNNIDINVNYLKIFLFVAKSGSFKKASDQLALSQPSISYSIKKLEEHFNIKLFIRQSKGIELTNAGKILFERVKEIFFKIQDCNNAIHSLSSNENEIINLGIQSHIFLFLKSKIFDFLSKNPGLHLNFVNESTSILLKKIEDDELDLIIDTAPINIDKKNYSLSIISEEKMCFVYSKKFQNRFNFSNSLDVLLSNPIILPSKESSVRHHFQQITNKNEIIFNPKYECPTTEILIEFVKNGLAIGYVFESAVTEYLQSGEFEKVDINMELPQIPLCLVKKNRELNPIIRKFIKFILKENKHE